MEVLHLQKLTTKTQNKMDNLELMKAVSPKLGLSMLKRFVAAAINFDDLKEYRLNYNLKERSIEFEVKMLDETIRKYPVKGDECEQLCKMVDLFLTEHLNNGTELDYLRIHDKYNPATMEDEIEANIFYKKDGEQIKQKINL